jgi:uncharacterized protein with PQ loop repeat
MNPSAMPLTEGNLLSVIAWSYLLINATRVLTYVPQVLAVWRCNHGARSVSLLTWTSWTLSHVSAVLYGTLVVADGFFVLISVVNLVGCAAVTAVAMRRRVQWRRTVSNVAPGVWIAR